MIQKNGEDTIKSNSSEPIEENDTEISNFKLLYQKTPNPERDKSSGVSSDEETNSSPIVPIPETLKQIRNKPKWTLSEAGDQYGLDTAFGCTINEKPTGNLLNPIEELRKKYTLQNERSVALKMDSANMMLDDILNSTNFMKTSTESLHSKSFKEQELKTKIVPENESTLTESSASHLPPCTHIFDHSHVPIAVDFLASQCHKHCNGFQPFHMSSGSLDKGASIPKGSTALIQRKKSFIEKFHDLQIGWRIQSVYKLIQKTRNPFARNRKISESIDLQQGIPGADCHRNVRLENEMLACNYKHNKCHQNHHSKKMILDLVEASENSTESKNTEREDRRCTCMKQKECNCPEVIPKCVCIETTCKARNFSFESPRPSLKQSENIKYCQTTHPVCAKQTEKDESGLLIGKENEDPKRKSESRYSSSKAGWRKISSEEKELIRKTDIYYFDHGNSAYYKTTDDHPKRFTESIVERTDEYATKFWAEFFGTLEIGVAFIISFILQLYRFLFTSIIRSLVIGIAQISSDYFFKPLLTIAFNGIIQPCLILAYNIATSVRDLCLPISQTFGFYAREIANMLASCRLIEININRKPSYCRHKV